MREYIIMTRKILTLVMLLFSFLFFMITSCQAREICVSTTGDDTAEGTSANPVRTIQRAMNMVTSNDDQISLFQGIYYEKDITWPAYSIMLAPYYNMARGVTIDAQGLSRVMRMDTIADRTIWRIDIINGYAGTYGGGIYAPNVGTLTLRHVIIKDCTAGKGGAIYSHSTNIDAEDCIFQGNKSTSLNAGGVMFGASGTGIGNLSTLNCKFINNGISTAYGGVVSGAKTMSSTVRWTARGCVFEGNSANGGAIAENAVFTAMNCLFINNTASIGGIIYSDVSTGEANFQNCTFYGNTGNGSISYKTKIYGKNNIMWGNGATLFYNLSSNNLTYSDIQAEGYYVNDGNISANPLFISTIQPYDFHMLISSECLDSGVQSEYIIWNNDMDGVTRPLGIGYDMGCYEQMGDKILPTGSITINSGETFSTSINVNLTLTATDSGFGMGSGALMKFKNETGDWSTPEAYTTAKSWQLSSAEGTKIVYASFCDAAGNWIATPVSDEIILDVNPPTGSVLINGGDVSTETNLVTLTNSANDTISGMGSGAQKKFSNNGVNWSMPEPYATSKSWALIVGSGARTVHALYSDVAGNWMATPETDSINVAIDSGTLIQQLDGFEGTTSGVTIEVVGSTVSCEVSTEEYESGKESLAVEYTGVTDASLIFKLPALVDMTSMEGIRLWLKGDSSSNYARIVLKESTLEADGELWQTPKFSLSDTNWHLVEYNFSTLTRASDSYSGNNIFDRIVEEYQIRFSTTSGSIFRNSYALLSASDGLLLAGDVRIMSGGGILYIDGISAVSDTTPPTVTLISPNGGESINGISTYSIIWTATDEVGGSGIPSGPATPITIKLSTDSGSTWSTIASSQNTGSYSWTVPNVTASTCMVKVEAEDALDHRATDESATTFSIRAVSGGSSTIASNVKAGPSPYDPSSGNMKITYELSLDADVTVSIYNLDGRLLWQNRYATAGTGGSSGSNSVEWDGITGFGSTIQTGVYIYQVTAGGKVIGRGKFIVRK